MSGDDDMDALFKALGDRTRRAILDHLKTDGPLTVGELANRFGEMSRIGVMKHLKALEEAGLLRSQRSGRQRKLFLNAVPLQRIVDRWTSEYGAIWARGLVRLKQHLEKDHDDTD
jgi:DNA-binding transcriptional ArsR family regulator